MFLGILDERSEGLFHTAERWTTDRPAIENAPDAVE